jgi:hypothetical protein
MSQLEKFKYTVSKLIEQSILLELFCSQLTPFFRKTMTQTINLSQF